jgi:hypothetical protein
MKHLIFDDQEERLSLLKKAIQPVEKDIVSLENPRFITLDVVIEYIKEYDIIYFDNDLGGKCEMYFILKDILSYFNNRDKDYSWMNKKTFFIHSKNTVAAQNIFDLLTKGFKLNNVDYLRW